MNTPKGQGIWIWQLPKSADGRADRLIEECLRQRFDYVWIKGVDGTARYRRNAEQDGYVADRLRAEGVAVGGWGYHYGARPETEARAALSLCAERGYDLYVVNAEREFEREDGARRMRRFIETFRAEGGASIALGLSTFALPSLHPRFPYGAALEGEAVCDFIAPQIYAVPSRRYPFLSNSVEYARGSFDELARFGRPILPTFRAYAGDGMFDWAKVLEQVECVLANIEELNLSSWNWWVWQSAERSPEVWRALRERGRGGGSMTQRLLRLAESMESSVLELRGIASELRREAQA